MTTTITQTVFKGDTENLPRRVPIAERLTPEFFERERRDIFRKSWVPVARASEVPDPGSYVVKDMPTFKTSLLVVRGLDNQIRVFQNVCTHRGNKLVRGGAGCKRSFVCGFHGWSFNPEGGLAGITDEGAFRDIDRALLNLPVVNSGVWTDYVFVHMDPHPSETLGEWLGELNTGYDGYFEQFEQIAGYRVTLKCNWNLAINSFTEGYHTAYIHRNTVPDYQGGKNNPKRHRPYVELMERHHRYSAPANPDHRIHGMEETAFRYGRKAIPAFTDDMTGMPPGINVSRHANWAFDVVQFFPNLLLLFGNSWYVHIGYWPIDHETIELDNRFFMVKAKNLGEKISQEWVLSRGRQVLLEDMNTLEAQHQMLAAGAISHVQLSQQEISLQHHYKVADTMLGIVR